MATSSGTVPDVVASQVLSVSPSLPTNKLLDNLTVQLFLSFLFKFLLGIYLEKSKTFTIVTTKLRKTSIFCESL
jgi:hypothetical protein